MIIEERIGQHLRARYDDEVDGFIIIDELRGQETHLDQEEADALFQFLDTVKSGRHKQQTEVWQFQLDDEIEHTLHGLRQVEHTLYEQLQHARFLREETVDGRRWIHVQSLTDISVQYRIPFEEVKTVSRVTLDGGTVTHHFDKGE